MLWIVLATTLVAGSPPHPPFRVGGDVKAPVAIRRVAVDFSGCRARSNGSVIVDATVDASGVVRDVRFVRSGVPCVNQAVAAAIKQWRFKPGTLNGRPVAVVFPLAVSIHYK